MADIQPTPSKGLGVHPARVCPSHNGDINMNNEEIIKYRKARPTIDSCIDDTVSMLMREIDPHEDYLIRQRYYRRICWQLAEDAVDAYLGNLEFVIEEDFS